jgi:cytoskeletal protein RodZ
MHEDPTRMMRQPDDHQPRGNTRLLVAGLIAVIVGLVLAVVVIANSGGSGTTSTVTKIPSETGSTTETTTGSTTETTTSTPTETTTTSETTTTPTETTTTTPPEEENGSGGIGAP